MVISLKKAGCSVNSQRPRVSGPQLFCASVGGQLAIIGQVARGIVSMRSQSWTIIVCMLTILIPYVIQLSGHFSH